MEAKMEVEGVDELVRFLRDAPKLLVMVGFQRALTSAAEIVADTLAYNAPEKEDNKAGGLLPEPGDLKSLVTYDIELDQQGRGGVATIGFRGRKAGTVAYWLEYGHRIVGHKPRKVDTGKSVVPNPFVRKTADQALPVALERFNASLADTIKREFPQ